MKADLIEVASLRTGDHVAGSYMAVWSLGQKAASAFAVGLALPLVSYLGFDPQSVNSPEALDALRYVITLPALVFYVLAIPIILRFPLSADRLMRMRSAFERRQQRREATAAGD